VIGAVRFRVWILVALLFVLHFLLHVGFGFGVGAPDLLTVSLLLAAREIGMERAAVMGLAFGLMEDALSVLAFGASSIALTFIGIGGAFSREIFVGDSRLFLVSYLFLGKWLRDLVHWIVVGEDLRQPFVEQVMVQGSVGGAYAAAIGMALVAVTGLGREA